MQKGVSAGQSVHHPVEIARCAARGIPYPDDGARQVSPAEL